MLPEIKFYPSAIPSQWDDIEIQAIYREDDGTEYRCEDLDASFYSVFLHNSEGIWCVADCPTESEAIVFADLIAKIAINYKDPEGYLLSTLNYKK